MMGKLYRNILLIIITTLLLPSCITNKQKLYLQDTNVVYPSVPFEEYKLCVNDEIIYYLMTSDEETQALFNGSQGGASSVQSNNAMTYQIHNDGCVDLPTLGKINIVGKTLKEAERILTSEFKKIIFDAEVKISLSNNYFYIQGDGGKGQFYLYRENLNIFQALAMAGDISNTGDKKHIKIIRQGSDGLDHVKTFDLRSESIIGSEYYYIKPNDVIYIPTNSNSFFRIDSFTSFVSFVVTPLSLIIMAVSLFNN
ncbi:polysaccharide export outer membrane protein [Dysgonomonadaceae bacterium PH5-43]|nr:polysaccharide export outer membrane protein [Dysgonomonadaceae bacterium PH5-43]